MAAEDNTYQGDILFNTTLSSDVPDEELTFTWESKYRIEPPDVHGVLTFANVITPSLIYGFTKDNEDTIVYDLKAYKNSVILHSMEVPEYEANGKVEVTKFPEINIKQSDVIEIKLKYLSALHSKNSTLSKIYPFESYYFFIRQSPSNYGKRSVIVSTPKGFRIDTNSSYFECKHQVSKRYVKNNSATGIPEELPRSITPYIQSIRSSEPQVEVSNQNLVRFGPIKAGQEVDIYALGSQNYGNNVAGCLLLVEFHRIIPYKFLLLALIITIALSRFSAKKYFNARKTKWKHLAKPLIVYTISFVFIVHNFFEAHHSDITFFHIFWILFYLLSFLIAVMYLKYKRRLIKILGRIKS